ncbi:AraC family transcriptional regulator [Nitratireductor arenosus]
MPILAAMTAPELQEASHRLGTLPGLHSGDIAEAVSAMSMRYRPHDLSLPGGGRHPIDFRHHAVEFGGATLNLLRYGPEVVIEAGIFEQFYMLEFPLSGGVCVDFGRRRVRSEIGRGLILSPGPAIHSNWRAGTTQLMLRIERGVVERAFRDHVGDAAAGTPVFAPEIDLDTQAGRRIARLLGLLVGEQIEADRHGTAALPAGPIVQAVLETVFAHIPYEVAETAVPLLRGPVPRCVHRFRALLDDPAMLALTVGDLARRIGVSQRTLTTDMRRFAGHSPHQYLTARRMDRACALLTRSDLPVAEIARCVGYANAGRFAALFRQAHGVFPADYRRFADPGQAPETHQ